MNTLNIPQWYDELLDCHTRISPYIHHTPVLRCRGLDALAGAELYFKCENFQRGGSYKLRGALNACQLLSPSQRARGVVTHSSGNFAAAVALASRSLGIKNYIVIPSSAPDVKVAAVRAYEGHVVMCEPTLASREATAAEIVAETGATLLHPSNDLRVILGQGTATWELLREAPQVTTCFYPVGGGGLIAGACIAAQGHSTAEDEGRAREKRKLTRVIIGGEPAAADDAYRSLQSGRIESNRTTDTIADGLRSELGDVNFPIIRQYVAKIIRVSESEIVEAMRLIWTRMKIVVEPSSAVALAALLQDPAPYRGQQVGILLSGGNVDLRQLPF